MKLPPLEVIHFKPYPGTHIDNARREAIAIAVEHSCDVEFGFNDKWYKVSFETLLSCVREHED
jgi:hypothetical protein